MTDKFSKIVRSRVMSKINSRNTKPEKLVRCMMHSLGYRFRLHDKNLPGKPDIVLKKYQVVVFVNDCFGISTKDVAKLQSLSLTMNTGTKNFQGTQKGIY